nr:protein LAZY 1-like [Tanacetum cinerariifolium]
MRKILKGRKGSVGTIDNASADKKLNKILHMFHRNVHPESTTKSQNRSRHVMNSSYVNDEGYKRRDQMLSGEDIIERDTSKMSALNTRTTIPQATCGASDSNGNKEFWIKSDADCKHINIRGVGTIDDKQSSTGCCTWLNYALEEVCYTNIIVQTIIKKRGIPLNDIFSRQHLVSSFISLVVYIGAIHDVYGSVLRFCGAFRTNVPMEHM